MTSVKISGLAASGTLDGGEVVPIVQNGVTVKAQVSDFGAYARTAAGNYTITGTLAVSGATTLSSTLAVTGASTLTGNVGIGIAPTNPLTVQGVNASGAVADAVVVRAATFAATGTGARVYMTAGGGIARSAYIEGVNSGGANNAHDVVLGCSASGSSPVERLRLSAALATFSTAATFTALVTTVASATGSAGLRLPHGTAPTSPVNGDMWTTTAGLFVRINGGTVGPLT